ncbi:MAG: gamma-glutamylcyclotransferase family protein [Bacteroidota bacterium]
MQKEYLFACGTLRKDYVPALDTKITHYLNFLEFGTVGARLYDLGEFPGAVPDPNYILKGDLFELPASAFVQLDEYEGCEFTRQLTKVEVENGGEYIAWIYFYNGSTEGWPLIESGDYLAHLKNKKTA